MASAGGIYEKFMGERAQLDVREGTNGNVLNLPMWNPDYFKTGFGNTAGQIVGQPFLLIGSQVAGTTNIDYELVSVAPFAFRVVDAWCAVRGSAVSSSDITLSNNGVANDITDGMSVGGADNSISRAGLIIDGYEEIAAGNSLDWQNDSGSTRPDADVFVLCIRVTD
jgi:hypothetical protein